jgi:serine phosphatase RsbU (regulator of sigma subunit)
MYILQSIFRKYYLVFFVIISLNSFSQSFSAEEIKLHDSLMNAVHNVENHDTVRINALLEIANFYYLDNPDTTIIICELAQKMSEEINYQKGKSESYGWLGYLLQQKGDIEDALNYYHKSLEIQKNIQDKYGMATSYNNIGYVYQNQGNIPLALEYYHISLKLLEELSNKKGMAASYNNLGLIYDNQGETSLALNYYQKSLKLLEEISDKQGMAYLYNNIGTIYETLASPSKQKSSDINSDSLIMLSLDNYLKSLKYREEISDKYGIAYSLHNIGGIYKKKAELMSFSGNLSQKDSLYILAMNYYQKSLDLREAISDKQGIANSLASLGFLCLDLFKHFSSEKSDYLNRARKYGDKGLRLARELGYPEIIRTNASLLSKVSYSEAIEPTTSVQKKYELYKEAFEMRNLEIQMRDSIASEEGIKAAANQQAKYEYEKQKALTDAETQKKLAIAAEQKEKQKIVSYAIGGVLVLLIFFLIFVYNRLNITRKQKSLIEIQKKEVEKAHLLLEEKNKEVMDSIRYAKRIQQALLKSEDYESQHLPVHFILFKPKDIVSGDFYWSLEKHNFLYLAAADCTGHGVPGAFLTMLGTSFLNEINATTEILTPANILNELRKKIIKELSQTGREGESKDGMDISLILLNLETNEMQWAGANNPLYIISGGQLKEIKGDKQSIGFEYDMKPFTNHTINLNKGDYVSIFSDGFSDQFGGVKGKKYKYTTFKNKLLEIHPHPLKKQKQLLEQEFENWKGDIMQVDDVCVIGLRL